MEKALFPNLGSLIVFVCYMVFCVGQGILVTASHSKEGYHYNTVTVVFLTEIIKLLLAYLCYMKDNSLTSLWHEISNNLKILCLYLVPSFLYCIYNNLAFVNLSYFDPTTYYILLQLRVVITGIIFQLVFHKRLTRMQWMSLVLLTCGCIIQQIDWNQLKNIFNSNKQSLPSYHGAFFSIFLIFIFIQTICSCFAGVYNEHLLKEAGANVNIFVQNIFMYIDSIFWNLIILFFQGNILSTFSYEAFQPIFQPLVLIIILNNSLVGITTSLFLKNLNSILKTFASAMEILFTAILCWILFKIEIKLNTVLAIVIVSYSLYVYSRNPVSNKNNGVSQNTKGEKTVSHLQEV